MKRVSDDDNGSRSGTTIQSAARAARLLLAVARTPRGLSAADAAAEIGVPQATAYHLLNTLRAEGLLAKAGMAFVLGPQAAVVAEAFQQTDAPPPVLLEVLRDLAAETGESAYLVAWREGGIRTLASFGGVRALRVATTPRGPYRSPHARATGKLLLAYADEERRAATLGDGPLEQITPRTITDRDALAAHLEQIRVDGYAEDREEFMEGVSCVAAPVLVDGRLIAALTVSAPSQRFERHRDELRDAVLNAARTAGGDRSPQPLEAA